MPVIPAVGVGGSRVKEQPRENSKVLTPGMNKDLQINVLKKRLVYMSQLCVFEWQKETQWVRGLLPSLMTWS